MQPYFFPYLGHFALISACDKWVVFDITQYTRKSWMTRNRVLHPRCGWNYVSVSLEDASISMKIFEAKLLSFSHAFNSLLGKLSHYRKHAPFYDPVCALISEIFSAPTDSLVTLNVRALASVCRYLEITFDYLIASKLELSLPEIDHPGGWAAAISQRLGATEYINPVAGHAMFRVSEFDLAGVRLKFLNFGRFEYDTKPYTFEESLSIIDVMMWNRPEKVREAIGKLSRIVDGRDVR